MFLKLHKPLVRGHYIQNSSSVIYITLWFMFFVLLGILFLYRYNKKIFLKRRRQEHALRRKTTRFLKKEEVYREKCERFFLSNHGFTEILKSYNNNFLFRFNLLKKIQESKNDRI